MEEEIRIVPYEHGYRKAFYTLNKLWIDRYFEMEPRDEQILGDPETHILNPGGHILVALSGATPVGVCALLVTDRPGYDYELTKMGVAPDYQERRIGWRLAEAVLALARKNGARRIFLESSTRLPVALNLYRKLGFREIRGGRSPYKRSDIRMGITL